MELHQEELIFSNHETIHDWKDSISIHNGKKICVTSQRDSKVQCLERFLDYSYSASFWSCCCLWLEIMAIIWHWKTQHQEDWMPAPDGDHFTTWYWHKCTIWSVFHVQGILNILSLPPRVLWGGKEGEGKEWAVIFTKNTEMREMHLATSSW